MAKRAVLSFVKDILESIDLLERYLSDMSVDEFGTNYEKQDAVVRRIEIIGEATKNLPQALRNKYTEIP